LWDRGYCSVRDSVWMYYNDKGDTLYQEYWNDGEFIKQVPEQDTSAIWKVDVTVNGKSVDNDSLTSEQVRQLVITPKYKTSLKSDDQISIKLQGSVVGYRQAEETFTLKNFNNVDVPKMIRNAGIPKGKTVGFTLMIYHKGINIFNFYFTVKQ
jgi:hypothetical protein